MKDLIKELKKLVSQLESYAYCDNYEKVDEITDNIVKLTSDIKGAVNGQTKKNSSIKNYTGLEVISTIDFLYKPTTKKDYYEGDYLEKFSQERTFQLKKAGVLELHDKFWTSNNVERGNIFGSIPKELISKEATKMLKDWGWQKAEVTIYEVHQTINLRDLIRICEDYFNNYLIATEKRNGDLIVLEYII